MSGFFTDIRGYFKGKFSGRYLAVVLRELARKEPASFARIIELAGKDAESNILKKIAKEARRGALEADCEISFPGAGGTRRADLVLRKNGKIELLFEIKEYDVRNPRNAAQTADYLARVTQEGTPFIHLSRFSPDAHDRDQMGNERAKGHPVFSIRYRDVHAALAGTERPLARMVRNYLEDIGVTTYQPISFNTQKSAITYALVKMLGFRHAHGKGRLASDHAVSELPGLLNTLFGNLEFLGDVIKERNSGIINQRFTRNLKPVPCFNYKKLAKALSKHGDGNQLVAELPRGSGQYVEHGSVEFYAHGRIRTDDRDDWLNVEIGYEFEVATGRTPFDLYLYAGFRGRRLKEIYKDRKCRNFPNEKQALKIVHHCLVSSLRTARRNATGSVAHALKRFQAPPLP